MVIDFVMSILRKILEKLRIVKKDVFFTKDFFIGEKFVIGDYSYGKPLVIFKNESANLYIGKYCSIASGVKIFLGGNHRVDWISTYPFNVVFGDSLGFIKGHPATKGDVRIGNDVWIGQDVIIMSGVNIGNGAVIAAGAVVSKSIGPYEIWAGNPAKFIRKRFKEEEIELLEKIKWWDWPVERIISKADTLCSANVMNIRSMDE